MIPSGKTVNKMKKVLAFFGAFNPPTSAHLALSRAAAEETGAEGVLFVPSRTDYIRTEQEKSFAYSNEERLGMLLRAAETRPWMRVSDCELRAAEQPRTYHTLVKLREEGYEPVLLLGSDKLPELEHGWRYVEEIAREFGIVCMARGEDDVPAMISKDPYLRSLSPYIRVLNLDPGLRHISSTEVRKKVTEIRDILLEIREMVPPEILPLLMRKEGEK